MEKYKIAGINESYYYEKLDNGLDVYLFPARNTKKYYLTFSTRFGSLVTSFKKEGDKDFQRVPKGVAHFLEHQLFERGDKKSAFEYFSKLGVDANAYTSFDVTCYEASGNSNFYKSLTYLINYVQTPFLTKEGVEKEKGIICEELKSGQDSVGNEVMWGIRKLLYHNDPHKEKVIGTIEDVMETTLEDLQICYDYFYHPSNMQIILSGNFNIKKTMELIKNNQNSKKFKEPVKIILEKVTEPDEVVSVYGEKEMNIETPNMAIGYKIPIKCFESLKLANYKLTYYLGMILRANFGATTELNQRLWDEKIILNDFSFSITDTCDHIVIIIKNKTPEPELLKEIIEQTIGNLIILKDDYLRFKKVTLSRFILSFDYVENKVDSLLEDILYLGKPDNNSYNDFIKDDYDTLIKVVQSADFSNHSTYVVKPMKDK